MDDSKIHFDKDAIKSLESLIFNFKTFLSLESQDPIVSLAEKNVTKHENRIRIFWLESILRI